MTDQRIIVAIDTFDLKQANIILDQLDPDLCMVKIGSVIFNALGKSFLKHVSSRGFKIFLDLKLHDIPNTVEKGIMAISKLKPIFTTIHIAGGDEMQKSSLVNKYFKTKILGVTILTSLNKKQTLKYYKEKEINTLVKRFARYAKLNNLDGIVCSPLEIEIVKKEVGNKMTIVVPGIRPDNSIFKKNDDQKRVLSPKEAITLGADYLVIGRPIVESKNPLEAIKKINQSIK